MLLYNGGSLKTAESSQCHPLERRYWIEWNIRKCNWGSLVLCPSSNVLHHFMRIISRQIPIKRA